MAAAGFGVEFPFPIEEEIFFFFFYQKEEKGGWGESAGKSVRSVWHHGDWVIKEVGGVHRVSLCTSRVLAWMAARLAAQ